MSASPSRVGLVLVAAGSGTRLGAGIPKAFVPLAGVPLVEHALRGALACPDIDEVVLVVPPTYLGYAVSSRAVTVVAGGAERGDSVLAGLRALSAAVQVVLVHDAARALTPPAVFARVVAAVRAGAQAVVPGVAVIDTVKIVDAAGLVTSTPDRALLRAVQTPQGFTRATLERAHAHGSVATDDAGLVERLGEPVLVVDGDPLAFKVTTPDDMVRAERALMQQSVP